MKIKIKEQGFNSGKWKEYSLTISELEDLAPQFNQNDPEHSFELGSDALVRQDQEDLEWKAEDLGYGSVAEMEASEDAYCCLRVDYSRASVDELVAIVCHDARSYSYEVVE